MKVCARQFNIYLALAFILALLPGCSILTSKPHGPIAALRIHIEASRYFTGIIEPISVLRSDPVLVTIAKDPILTEANIIAAKIINVPGGFAIQVRFDETGSTILEQYTAVNTGLHLVIFGQWGEKLSNGRWLAAPLITHRIGNGTLAFTPDMSLDEAQQLITGLNNLIQFNARHSE